MKRKMNNPASVALRTSFSIAVASLLLVVLAATTAEAVVVSCHATGTVDSASNLPGIGSTFDAWLSYDTGAAVTFGDGINYAEYNGISPFIVSSGSFSHVSNGGVPSVFVAKNLGGDQFEFSNTDLSPILTTAPATSVDAYIMMTDSSQTALSDVTPPAVLDASRFDSKTIGVSGVDGDHNELWSMSGTITNITFSPEPSTLTLLGLGAISLAGYAWRRRAK